MSTPTLDRANEVRFARTHIKRTIRELPYTDGCAHVAALLADPPECIHAMPVIELLTCIRHTGPDRAERWLDLVGASPLARVAGDITARLTRQNPAVLTARQRASLRAILKAPR